eukprot:CAMPEP_0181311118 /NCGR_PEP_ID=MMETSP1101-20121128/12959_1 /TAXON_ID=46948 /ORGANISM="Rhodomonas abbreviata, Strain Caron Lab Isolate" /LENGTH=81 /DNA_ID=CAMNT_0023417813 /DNA_START=20 /DNA_END=265 /DNA_ORIENTATION=-
MTKESAPTCKQSSIETVRKLTKERDDLSAALQEMKLTVCAPSSPKYQKVMAEANPRMRQMIQAMPRDGTGMRMNIKGSLRV